MRNNIYLFHVYQGINQNDQNVSREHFISGAQYARFFVALISSHQHNIHIQVAITFIQHMLRIYQLYLGYLRYCSRFSMQKKGRHTEHKYGRA